VTERDDRSRRKLLLLHSSATFFEARAPNRATGRHLIPATCRANASGEVAVRSMAGSVLS
jgi:hypothetical protein